MIFDCLDHLNQKRLILASRSPRRRELMRAIGLNVEIQPTDIVEDGDQNDPVAYARMLAERKNDAVSADADLIIASDTVVYIDQQILEKPADETELHQFLRRLSGRIHHVYTAVSLRYRNHRQSFVEETEVEFNKLPDSLIIAYGKTNEPYDKAGGYGIQATGATFVKAIRGCYFNVMGFPISSFSLNVRDAIQKGYV